MSKIPVKLLSLSNILLDRGMRLKINETCADLAKEYKLKYLKKDTSLQAHWNSNMRAYLKSADHFNLKEKSLIELQKEA